MSLWPGVDGAGVVPPSFGGTGAPGAVVIPRWWNPLNSAAIDARIAAGGLWAWRAQANDNVTWGAGPANYAASRISVEGGLVNLAEIGGAVNWAAATGWGGFRALGRCLNTQIVPDVTVPSWIVFIQYSAVATLNASPFGVYDNVVPIGTFTFNTRTPANSMRAHHGDISAGDNAPALLTGNYGIGGKQPYRNGVAEPAAIVGGGGGVGGALVMYIGARNLNGAFNQGWNGDIQAVLICDSAAVFGAPDITAIAGLPAGSMHNL